MEAVTYRLDQFEGPLDLLLMLIHKNKVQITDIPISLICDQYLEYIQAARDMDMEVAGEFIVMASELMLIKSRLLLPKVSEDEKDPRAELADALLRYQQAKQAVEKLTPRFRLYSGRMVKDTDELSPDPTFVADQQVTSLCLAVRRMIAANESRPRAEKQVFAPMIAKPIVSVDVKIIGILQHMEKKASPSMQELLADATSVSDLIAIFLGILELIKLRKILIDRDQDADTTVHGTDTRFIINENADAKGGDDADTPPAPVPDDGEPIPLSSKAEMHREQRRILREAKLAEKKRLREEERARRRAEREAGKLLQLTAELPEDDSDLEAESRMEALIDDHLSGDAEDILDDIGLDMDAIMRSMAKQAEQLPDDTEA